MPSTTKRQSKAKDVAPLLPTVDPSDSPLEGAAGYEITKVVNLSQLQFELTEAAGEDDINMAVTGDVADDDAVLWVTPPKVDPQAIADTVAAHVPNAAWGISTVILDYNTLLSELQQNPEMDLTADQVTTLVKGNALTLAASVAPRTE